METKPKTQWPRLRDLPENEREVFGRWLTGQTCPVIQGEPDSEQDGYYQHDYETWKSRSKHFYFRE